MSKLNQEQSLALLKDSLKDAQDTVRAYDTKAQIVGVGYIFALNVISQVGQLNPDQPTDVNLLTIIIPWIFVILPIMLFGWVLYPTRNSPKLLGASSKRVSKHILFFEPSPNNTVEDIKAAVLESDPIDEVAYELLKVSKLREIKRSRFLRALFGAGLAFWVLFTSHIYMLLF